jgi:hypothetical protein
LQFASFFLNDPEVAPERAAFLEVLQELLPESARRQVCSVVGCFLPRCTLTGSMYCFPHHALKFHAPPSLDDFLRNSHYCALFREWMVLEHAESLPTLEFFFKAEDFAEVRSRATLASRAPSILRKYLAPDARKRTPLGDWGGDEELACLLQEVQEAIASSTPPKNTLFLPLQRRAHASLQGAFQGHFQISSVYQSWADENTGLPLPQMPAARAALLEQLGISQEDAFGLAKRSLPADGAAAAGGGSSGLTSAAAGGGSSLADAFLSTTQCVRADGAESSALASYECRKPPVSAAARQGRSNEKGCSAAATEGVPGDGALRPPQVPLAGGGAAATK